MSTAALSLLAFRALAVLTLIGALVQFFLAGMTVFGAGTGWEVHAAAGGALGVPVLGLLGLSFFQGLRSFRPLAAALSVLYLLQLALAGLGQTLPMIGALHPVNGLLLGLLAARLVSQLVARSPVRQIA